MTTIKTSTLRVPGASLYYETRGSGPVLLMIPPGAGDARSFNGIVNHLAAQYTVVTYDRRGCSHSKIDDPAEDVRVETHSDDARCLLATLTNEPAYVFGSSAGALIGLDLAIRYPEQVRALVAHEPPVQHLLPEAKQPKNIQEIYRRDGAVAALQKLMVQVGVSYDDREPGVELPQPNEQSAANSQAFFAYTLQAVQRYTLDIAALSATPTRIVLAGGSTGQEYIGYRCAAAVANLLGTSVVEFPSHHAGFVSHPRAFSERLREVLNA
ncbi:MAG: alpha/beta fold hydrolase [Ktedonobacteraceae bacterium]|nr:alpha/beta fold hydrolase [Ktedonobacteraceae bacterium]